MLSAAVMFFIGMSVGSCLGVLAMALTRMSKVGHEAILVEHKDFIKKQDI
jgi:hypothetical protein